MIRSNSSASTGSNQLPTRLSTPAAPLISAFSFAHSSARSFRSTPITRSLCLDAMSAWIPDPVPRSSALRDGRRTVRSASIVPEGFTPVT